MSSPLKVDPKTVQAYLHNRHVQSEPVDFRRPAPEITPENRIIPTGKKTNLNPVVRAGHEVLTPVEQNTLEALFGPRRASTPEFYGSTKVRTLYKGQLLDITG